MLLIFYVGWEFYLLSFLFLLMYQFDSNINNYVVIKLLQHQSIIFDKLFISE